MPSRRDFLIYGAVAGGAILGLGRLIDVLDHGEATAFEVDLSTVGQGSRITVQWHELPIFISHRTPAEIELAQSVDLSLLPDPQSDAERVARPEWLVVVGICSHLGCTPLGQKGADPRGRQGGWYCPCHGSSYDTSGRVRGGPAPKNLAVPPYTFSSPTVLRIGARGGPAAAKG